MAEMGREGNKKPLDLIPFIQIDFIAHIDNWRCAISYIYMVQSLFVLFALSFSFFLVPNYMYNLYNRR